LLVKILLFVFVALFTNVKVVSTTITFPNIQEKTNSNLFHTKIAKAEFKFSENDLANTCKSRDDLVDYRNWDIFIDTLAATTVTRIESSD